jgi:hypothetical protein
MGLLNWFKKKGAKQEDTVVPAKDTAIKPKSNLAPTVPEEEKKYYRSDDYYQIVTNTGTPFEHKVVTFEERKKVSYPSARGLYVGEILLLYYCKRGDYPHPKNGYPGFWWFKYGIRDVSAALSSLEKRNFIEMESAEESAHSLKVPELKALLKNNGLPTSGKKADLVARVADSVPKDEIIAAGAEPKYHLTDLGKAELSDNEYVPYMHRCRNITIENTHGPEFNVWSVNRALGNGDKSNWRDVVAAQEKELNIATAKSHEEYMSRLESDDPISYNEIKEQDDQLAEIQRQEKIYSETQDLDSYILFWEKLWSHGGLKFEGVHWMFRLADLYIKAKRYDDALRFVIRVKQEKDDYYRNKADYYIERINKLKDNQK